MVKGREAEALKGLTAVDGSFFAALPRMAWALWDTQHRGVKLHLHFDVLKGIPCDATLTPAACSEPRQLKAMLEAGRLYVLDRGYASYELLASLVAAGNHLHPPNYNYCAEQHDGVPGRGGRMRDPRGYVAPTSNWCDELLVNGVRRHAAICPLRAPMATC